MKVERIAKPRSKNTNSWHPFCYARRLWQNCEKSETPIATLSFSIIGNGIDNFKTFLFA